jgi:hypothetical protein
MNQLVGSGAGPLNLGQTIRCLVVEPGVLVAEGLQGTRGAESESIPNVLLLGATDTKRSFVISISSGFINYRL